MVVTEKELRDIDGNGPDYDESIPESILKEIQQYRAIGTMQELTELKNNCIEPASLRVYLTQLEKYKSIGSIEEFITLKEKNVAKELKHGVCPNCSTNNDKIIKHLGNPQAHKVTFCWNCGQALTCSKMEDESYKGSTRCNDESIQIGEIYQAEIVNVSENGIMVLMKEELHALCPIPIKYRLEDLKKGKMVFVRVMEKEDSTKHIFANII